MNAHQTSPITETLTTLSAAGDAMASRGISRATLRNWYYKRNELGCENVFARFSEKGRIYVDLAALTAFVESRKGK